MSTPELQASLSQVTAAHLADACLRLGIEPRCAPSGLVPVGAASGCFGPVRAVRHYGSVDVFLEAIAGANPTEILVVDNQGRLDEGCIGDLVTLEARNAGLGGILIWGAHRDTAEIERLGLPVFSYGSTPCGPRRLDARDDAPPRFGDFTVSEADIAVCDADGAIFLAAERSAEILSEALRIRDVELNQAELMAAGATLRDLTGFAEYLQERALDPSLTFREHIRRLGAAVET
jgi:4-hydroxy-4-methyl-2-oxoglutarate aldolase